MSDRDDELHADFTPSRSRKPGQSRLAKVGVYLFTQALAFLALVGFPAFWTAFAPVSWITLERREETVSASVRTCLLFVVPYRQETLSPVTGFSDRIVDGTYSSSRNRSNSSRTKSEDQGFLVIQNETQHIEVQVSPASIESVIERSEAFLSDPQAEQLKLFVVANWKFSVFGGGLLAVLPVLYFGALILGVVIKGIHFIQRLCGVPVERRLFAKIMR